MVKKACLGVIGLLFVSLLYACDSYSELDFTESPYTIENDVCVSHYTTGVSLEEAPPFTKHFDSHDAFETYRETAYEGFENEPFLEHLDQFNAVYFEDHTLIILYVVENSGSNQHRITGLEKDGNTLVVNALRKVPSIGTTDMAYWIMTLAGEKEVLEGDTVSLEFESFTPRQ